ncbi:hypothetical protein DEU56DRAFT_691093, partial [Suillus clintonianus]|uniref:uncharacterized protein n=1 Tax=Suillus clintonianus TaxID=1904413 RepID=UPI001B85D9D4
HANVLPFQQTLRKTCYRAAIRMATLPAPHPLVKEIKGAYEYSEKRQFKGRKRYPSPLHRLMNEFQTDPSKIEKIEAVRHYPKWEPDVDTRIAETKERAVEEDKSATEDLRVYSDGSATEGKVGGAVVLMRGDEAELIGMILALELLREEGVNEGRTMVLGVDNQAAIRAMTTFQSRPGHYLADIFHDDLR